MSTTIACPHTETVRSFEAGIAFSIVAIRIAATRHDGPAKAALLEVAQYLQADVVPDEAAFAAERERG